MSDYAAVQLAVTEYARDYITSLIRRGLTYQKIGERLGCSHVWVMHLSNPGKYGQRLAGPDLEHNLAQLLHGGSVDALRRAALHLASGGAVVNEDESGTVELGPRAASVAENERRAAGSRNGAQRGRGKPRKPAK